MPLPDQVVSFRLWPPSGVGGSLLLGWVVTAAWGPTSRSRASCRRGGVVLLPLSAFLLHWGAIRPKEQFLHERFGAEYDDYARRVRRWL
jgi:protein-S-isoprenylcysteine O-methyltransferase Ste14